MSKNFLANFFKLYIDGFKSMKLGKTLWLVIFVKVFILVFVFKMLIFNTTIDTKFQSEEDKIDFIHKNLTKD